MPISQETKTKNYIDFLPNLARRINAIWDSTLALLVTRLTADHTHDTFATDDFAFPANLFDRGLNTHMRLLSSTHFARKTMRARLKS
jgi:hypothetical protein